MELEFNHIQPYMLSNLKLQYFGDLVGRLGGYMEGMGHNPVRILYNGQDNKNINADMQSEIFLRLEDIKPILFPLSQIKEYFEPIFETDKEVNEYLSYEATTPFSVDEILDYKFEYLPYGTCQVLLKHHFDLFGLIEKGLAVDINTLSVE